MVEIIVRLSNEHICLFSLWDDRYPTL